MSTPQQPYGYQPPQVPQPVQQPYGNWSQVPPEEWAKQPEASGLAPWIPQPAPYAYPQEHPEAGNALGFAIAGLLFPFIGIYSFFLTKRLRREVTEHNYQGRQPFLRPDGNLTVAWVCSIVGLVSNIFLVFYMMIVLLALAGTLAVGQS